MKTKLLLTLGVFLAVQMLGLFPNSELRAMCIHRHHAFSLGASPKMQFQQPAWRTLAGYPSSAGTSDGTGWTARFSSPYGIASAGSNGVYVADTYNYTIRRISPDGTVSTYAGTPGVSGYRAGPAGIALFSNPTALTADANGNLYLADGNVIWKITSGGMVNIFAGMTNASGYRDGPGTNAYFNTISGLAVDKSGNVFVADAGNSVIRKITPAGMVSTLAGNPGYYTWQDGAGTNAYFAGPAGITVDSTGFVYVADAGNFVIRKVTPDGQVSTLAGQPYQSGYQNGSGLIALFNFNNPSGLTVDALGNLFVADNGNLCIRKITPDGVVSTVAGAFTASGHADGFAPSVRFVQPTALCFDDQGHLLVVDSGDNTIRIGDLAVEPHLEILVQPTNQIVSAGSNAVFQVVAQGTASLTYQWFIGDGYFGDDQAISGATNAILVLQNAQSSDTAIYRVAVSDGIGYLTTLPVNLQVTTLAGKGLFASWHLIARTPISSMTGVAYGNSRYVAVGAGGTLDSTDGVTWNRQNPQSSYALNGVAFGNSEFVAVGTNGTVLISADGSNWSNVLMTPEVMPNLQGIAFDQGVFVAVGSDVNGSLWTSTDGITWTNRGFDFDMSFVAVASGAGRFVAVGNTILSSTNAEDWEPVQIPPSIDGLNALLGYIAYGNGLFLASEADQASLIGNPSWFCHSDQGRLFASTTGLDWQEVTPDPTNGLFLSRVVFGNGRFVAYDSYSGGTCFSKDGINWSTPVLIGNLNESINNPSFGFVHDRFVAVGDDGYGGAVFTSSDAASWDYRNQNNAIPFQPSALLNVNGNYFGCGNGQLITSTNGADWILSPPTNIYYQSITYGTNMLVAVGGGEQITTSIDMGVHWVNHSPAFNYGPQNYPNLNEIIFGGNSFVVVGSLFIYTNSGNNYYAHAITSTDGINWQLANTHGITGNITQVAYGNGAFVALDGQYILASTNSLDWQRVVSFPHSTNNNLYLSSVAFGNNRFVIIGNDQNGSFLLNSVDGRGWMQIPFAGYMYGLVFGNGFFMGSDGSGNVYSSVDGITWNSYLTPLFSDSLYPGEGTFLAYSYDAYGNAVGLFESDPIEQLGQPNLLPDGQFGLTVTGARNLNYNIEASDDLLAWQVIATVTNSTPTQPFIDADAATHPTRFYRLRSP